MIYPRKIQKELTKSIPTPEVVVLTGMRRVGKITLYQAIFGGLSLQAWKRVRSTLDVDIMVLIKQGDVGALIDNLSKKGLRSAKENPQVDIGGITLFRFIYPDQESSIDIKVDIAVARGGFPEEAVQNRLKLNIFGRDMWFVRCEDLILLKLLSNRPIDNADARELIHLNRELINKDYRNRQAIRLKVYKCLMDIVDSPPKYYFNALTNRELYAIF